MVAGRTARIVCVFIITLAGLASAQPAADEGWDQYRGGGSRSGVVQMDNDVWDLIGTFKFLEQPGDAYPDAEPSISLPYGEAIAYGYGVMFIETPAGIVASARDHEADTCFFVVFDEDLAPTRHDLAPCDEPVVLQGYDRARAEMLACHVGRSAEPVLVAYTADLEVSWQLTAAELLGPDDPVAGLSPERWTCSGIAIEDGLYVPLRPAGEPGAPAGTYFTRDGRTPAATASRLAHVVDGVTQWSALYANSELDPALDPFLALAATMTASGVVTTGVNFQAEFGASAHSLDGEPLGSLTASATLDPDDPASSRAPGTPGSGSPVVVARNDIVHAYFGGIAMTWDVVDGQTSYNDAPGGRTSPLPGCPHGALAIHGVRPHRRHRAGVRSASRDVDARGYHARGHRGRPAGRAALAVHRRREQREPCAHRPPIVP